MGLEATKLVESLLQKKISVYKVCYKNDWINSKGTLRQKETKNALNSALKTARCSQVQPGTAIYSQLQPGASWYFKVLQGTSRYNKLLQGDLRYFNVLLCTSRYIKVLPDTSS